MIVSGDRVEVWCYENPIRADLVDRHCNFPKDIITDDQNSGGLKFDSNLRRARFSIRQLVWSNITDYTKFITLTYAETVLDFDKLNYDIKQFFKKLKRKMKFDPRYIWVPEPQRSRGAAEGNTGCLHVHIVLFNCEKIPLDVLNSCWPHGRTDIRILNGCRLSDDVKIKSAAAYLSKYISKDNIVGFGRHCFRASLNLNRPVQTGVYCFKMSDEDKTYFCFDDRSFDLSNFQCEYKNSYLFNYEVNGEPVQNCCLYMQGSLKHGSK